MNGIIALAAFVVLTVFGNLFLKRGALELSPLGFNVDTLIAAVKSGNVWLGVVLYSFAAVSWFVSLSLVPLNLAITVSACIYVLVVLMAFFIFQEAIPPLRWTGIAIVFSGLIVIGRTL